MEKHNRINWKRGLLITPEILIASDNYHISERNLLGAILASRSYGILPDSEFYLEKEIVSNCLTIKNLNCFAITKEGTMIGIPKALAFKKELPLHETIGNEFYVILSVNQKGMASEDDNKPFIYPDYQLSLKKTSETVDCGIPLLMIKNDSHWEIVRNYIPPSISLNSTEGLLRKFADTKNLINQIIEKYPNNTPEFFQINLLKLELNDFSPQKSPEEWTLLMKKFCWFFYSHLKNENKIEGSRLMHGFINEPFNPDNIEKTIQGGFDSFAEIDKIFDIQPVEEIEEIEIKL